MNDAYLSAITQSEDTSGAIEELKSRGIRFRDRGLKVLGSAGGAAVLAVGALLLYMNIQPMSAFTTIDLPALSDAVASMTAGPAGITSPFNTVFDSMRGIASGTLPKILAVAAIAISGVISVATGRMTTAITGVMMAMPIMLLPSILDGIAPSSSSSGIELGNGNSFVRQLVAEKRYKELSGVVGELMPSDQAAYVKAQIAYLSKDGEALKVELGTLAGSKLEKWTPNWERMNVLETEAFGAPRIKGTVAFADDIHSSLETRQKIYSNSGAFALVAGLIGSAIFGFGMMLIRRARRLEAMLGIVANNADEKTLSLAAMSYFGQNKQQQLEEARTKALELQRAEWKPAWQRTDLRSTPEPVFAGASADSSGPSMMESALIGVAAGAVLAEVLDNDHSSRSSHASTSDFGANTESASIADSCVPSGDCGASGCE